MPSPSIVRRAFPEDRDSIWSLLMMLHSENGIFKVSEPKLNWVLDRLLHPERIPPDDAGLRGFMGVIGPVGALEGFISLVLASDWYSDDIYLEELANFVHPDFRKSNHAKTFLLWSRKVADSIGVPLRIGIISTIRTEAKVRLYKRFFTDAGHFFYHNASIGTNREHANGQG